MANNSLDLGTLVAHIKTEGEEKAKRVFNSVADAIKQAGLAGTSAGGGVGSFMSAVKSGLGNVGIMGTNVQTLSTALLGGEGASIALGTALGGVCTAGILTAVDALKNGVEACAEFVRESNQVGISYQQQMSTVAAISGATEKEFKQLDATAKQLGKDTIFSATEVGQAMEYTALAGWKVSETISGLPGILNLASASKMDLARASDIVTDNLTAFNMKVSESTHLADVMAYAMSHSNTSTEQLGQSYKNCASTCAAMGLSVEEATAWLGKMADAGTKGGESGSALNAILARMYGETKTTNDALQQYGLSMYDVNGKAKNFTKVIGEIQEKMKGMSDEEKNIFSKAVAGVNHLSDFNNLLKASASDVEEMTRALERCNGTSDKMTKTMTDNIAGLQKSIGSKVEAIQLSLFAMFEPMESSALKIVETVTSVIGGITQPIGNVINTLLTPAKDVIFAIGDSIQVVGTLIGELINGPATAIVDTINVIWGPLENTLSVTIDSLKTIGDLLKPICDTLQTLTGGISEVKDSAINAATDVLVSLGMTKDQASNELDDFNAVLFGGLGHAGDDIKWALKQIGIDIQDTCDSAVGDVDDATNAMIEDAEDYTITINDITKENYDNFYAMYEAIQTLDSETYGELQNNAMGYVESYKAQMDALDQFVKDGSREMTRNWEKQWEERHKGQTKSVDFYLEKAKYQLDAEEKLNKRANKERMKIDEEYTNKLQKEVNYRKSLEETTANKGYKNDYANFAKKEEDKTAKYVEEVNKRIKAAEKDPSANGKGANTSTGLLTSIVTKFKGYANGTSSVPTSGTYLTGEFGPEIITLPKGASVTPNNSITRQDNTDVVNELKNLRDDMQNVMRLVDELPWKQKQFSR